MSKAARAVAAIVVTAAAIFTLNPTLIQAAVAMDSAVIAGALAPKPPSISSGSESRWKADPRAGIPYAVGRCAIAGDIRFERSAPVSGNNKYKNFVTVYTVGPIQAYEGFYANNNLVPFTADGGEGASGYYLNRMWMKRQLGLAHEPYLHWTATGSKDTPANHGGLPTGWTPAHKLSGYAASLWGLEWDTARYAGGVPPPKMVGLWQLCYDPRKDSTYPGGLGSHRYADPADKAAYLAAKATWEWSKCPYLHGLKWALGTYTGDPDLLDQPLVQTHGIGLDIEDVDVAAFVEGANVAAANDWTLGGQVYSTDDRWEVLKAFLQAGGGEPILLGDKLSCLVNTPKVSVATLTGRDAVGEVSLDAAVPYNERLNTVWPSWTVEELAWELTPAAAPVQVSSYVTVDKGVRSKELSLPLVQSATQAGQLSRYLIEDSRELTNIVIPARPEWMWLEPGKCITANEPAWGLNGQKLLILKRVRDPATMVVTLICRTETDGKHAFALGQTATPPDTPALTGVDPNIVPLPANGAWGIVGGVVAGESGSLPGIVITGEADLYDAVTIVVDYREVFPTDPVTYGGWESASFPVRTPDGVTRTVVVSGVKAGARYQVRVRYITARGVENPDSNTDLGDVVVGGVLPSSDVIDAINKAAGDARAAALAVLEEATNRALADDLIDRALHTVDGLPLGPTVSEQMTITEEMVETVSLIAIRAPGGAAVIEQRDTVIVDTETGETRAERDALLLAQDAANTAAIGIEAATRASADAAEALARLALQSDFDDNVASVNSALLTLSDADSALSAALLALSSEVDDNKASADSSIATLTTATSALATAQLALEAEVDANKASADSSITTLTTTTSAIADSVTTLSATVGDHTASIETFGTALADINDSIAAVYGFKLDVDGKVIGMVAVNDGVGGTPDTITFDADGVIMTGDLFVDGQIHTPGLAEEAVTIPEFAFANDLLTGTGGTQIGLSLNLVLVEDCVISATSCIAWSFPSGDQSWSCDMRIDGTVVFSASGARSVDVTPLSGQRFCTGGRTVSVDIRFSGNSNVRWQARNISAVAMKR